MVWLLSVILAGLSTIIISLIAIPIFTFLYMFILGFTLEPLRKRNPRFVVFLMQFIGYASSDFSGLFVGSLILKKTHHINFLPVLFVIIVISSLRYFLHKFSFETAEAEQFNRNQKIANLLGAVTAIACVFLISRTW